MTTTTRNLPAQQHVAPAAAPGRVGQGTAVEQSRAVAEVQAAVVVAQQVPRQIDVARIAMQESCAQIGLADRAFYSFPRGGQTVAGPTVYLARELARCWGNVQHGIAELRRDDAHGESEMQAWAWDVQTNTRTSQTFIVPHKRDKRGGPEVLTDLRDIYENNANQGARRLREAIFAILPPWFVEEAVDICRATLNAGDGRPLEERITGAVAAFDSLGVTAARLEQKLGRPRDRWTGPDLAQLRITHKSIQRGEITVDDAFPQARVTLDELAPAPQPATAPAPQPEPQPEPQHEAPAAAAEHVADLKEHVAESVDAAQAARQAVESARRGPDLEAAAQAGQKAAARVAQRNAEGQAPPAIKASAVHKKAKLVFAEHIDVAPGGRGGKKKLAGDRLTYGLATACAGQPVTSLSEQPVEVLLKVWQRLEDIEAGRMTYTAAPLDDAAGITFTSSTGKETTVLWAEFEDTDGDTAEEVPAS